MAQWDYDREEAQTLILILSVEGRRRGIQKQRHSLRDTRCDSPVPYEEECVGWASLDYVSLCVSSTKPGCLDSAGLGM